MEGHMKNRPITENCRRNFQLRKHACFGISPFNSYFSEERIRDIALWGKAEFDSMHFFVPDVPSAYTLEALGYEPEKAAWKARRQCQYLHNKIHKALKSVGYSDSDACKMVLNWETLAANPRYLQLHEEVKALFDNDPRFQDACTEASRWVLEKRLEPGQTFSQEMLRSAARYLLTEIPLFIDTAGIVGKSASVFCYHQCIEFLEDLFHGRYGIAVASQQGFLVTEPTNIQQPTAVFSKAPAEGAMDKSMPLR
jgi:cyclo(L-tyrosyl-L-tyrosyl) synthase